MRVTDPGLSATNHAVGDHRAGRNVSGPHAPIEANLSLLCFHVLIDFLMKVMSEVMHKGYDNMMWKQPANIAPQTMNQIESKTLMAPSQIMGFSMCQAPPSFKGPVSVQVPAEVPQDTKFYNSGSSEFGLGNSTSQSSYAYAGSQISSLYSIGTPTPCTLESFVTSSCIPMRYIPLDTLYVETDLHHLYSTFLIHSSSVCV